MIRIACHKEVANTTAALRADRNVLQVGVGGRQASRCRHGLVKGRMNASRHGMNQLRQGIDVRAFELAHLAPFEELFHDGMLFHIAFQDLLSGGILPRFGLFHFAPTNLQSIKEHISQLLGRAQVEGLAGQLENIRFQARQIFALTPPNRPPDPLWSTLTPANSMSDKHRKSRGPPWIGNWTEPAAHHSGRQGAGGRRARRQVMSASSPAYSATCGRGPLSRIGLLVLALGADQRRDGNGRVAEQLLSQIVHAVALIGLDQVVHQHRVHQGALARECHSASRTW